MALAILLGTLTIGSSVALMTTSAWLISRAAQQPSVAVLGIAIVGVRFFGISRGVLRYLERLVSHDVTFRILAQLRVWFYQQIEPLAPARLMAYRSGDLLNRVISDIETLQNVFLRVIAPPIVAILIGIGTAIFMAFYSPLLSLVLLIGLTLGGFGVPTLTHWLGHDLDQRMVETQAELKASLVDGIQGMADVVAFGQQIEQQQKIQRLNRNLVRSQQHLARIDSLHEGLGAFLTITTTLVMLALAIPIVDGLHLAVIVLGTLASFEAVTPLPTAFRQLESSLLSAKRLFEIASPSATGETQPTSTLEPTEYSLKVGNLTFAYEDDAAPALNHISFELKEGQKIAIVGPSGAGKSTLLNLLLRFWDYDTGSITLGSHDLRDYAQDTLLKTFGVVAQNTHLFNATVHENLLLANPKATNDDIIRAAQAAQIHDFIVRLPDGYQTWIGEQGMQLSGGERQRLSIARVFLKDAPILVLDEATANLDAVTEQAVLTALHRLMEKRTTLMITHRLVGLEKMDEILVLHEGRIVERGQHHELMQVEGVYWQMLQQQNQIMRVDELGHLQPA
jgi:ATP-binding cassette subfamily C protein CydC